MLDKLIIQWKAVLFSLLAVIITQLLRWFEVRRARHKTLTDAEYLSAMARYRETSEYELFRVAARQWRLGHQRIDHDFKRYLLENIMPFYVTDFVRKARARRHETAPVSR